MEPSTAGLDCVGRSIGRASSTKGPSTTGRPPTAIVRQTHCEPIAVAIRAKPSPTLSLHSLAMPPQQNASEVDHRTDTEMAVI